MECRRTVSTDGSAFPRHSSGGGSLATLPRSSTAELRLGSGPSTSLVPHATVCSTTVSASGESQKSRAPLGQPGRGRKDIAAPPLGLERTVLWRQTLKRLGGAMELQLHALALHQALQSVSPPRVTNPDELNWKGQPARHTCSHGWLCNGQTQGTDLGAVRLRYRASADL